MVIPMTTTLPELDERVSVLEEFVRHDLSVKVDAMNWALGLAFANTEAARQDMAGIKVEMAHMEASTHADLIALKTNLDLRVFEVRRDLRTTEASIRHDMRQGFEAVRQDMVQGFGAVDRRLASVDGRFEEVDGRFEEVDGRFEEVGGRFDAADQRFDRLEAKVDAILAKISDGKE
jgi:hypothetical protein